MDDIKPPCKVAETTMEFPAVRGWHIEDDKSLVLCQTGSQGIRLACSSLLFWPPGHGFSTLDARCKLLIAQYTSGIVRGDTVV
jgi:hypothetical protein